MKKKKIIPVLTPEGPTGLDSVIHTDPQGSWTGIPRRSPGKFPCRMRTTW